MRENISSIHLGFITQYQNNVWYYFLGKLILEEIKDAKMSFSSVIT